jgi:hypothetical protein
MSEGQSDVQGLMEVLGAPQGCTERWTSREVMGRSAAVRKGKEKGAQVGGQRGSVWLLPGRRQSAAQRLSAPP